MESQTTTDDRLDGWESISGYLGWHVRTVIRWEKQKGLPVHRIAGGKRQPVYAYRHEIDMWFQGSGALALIGGRAVAIPEQKVDRKSTRLNSSHLGISYAVFCL